MPNPCCDGPVRLVLADDHPLMLQALMALEAVRRFQPDLLVLDVRMTYMDGMRPSNKWRPGIWRWRCRSRRGAICGSANRRQCPHGPRVRNPGVDCQGAQ